MVSNRAVNVGQSGSLSGIPVIDFSPFLRGDRAGQRWVAAEIYRACHDVGFLYLTGHGIPKAAINDAFGQARGFFALPLGEKQAIAWSSEASNRGYVGIERERLDETQPGDIKEAFNLGPELSVEAAAAMGVERVLNRWPEGRDEFRVGMLDFFSICSEAVTRVFRAFAIALDMPEAFFVSRHVTHSYTLRLLHYPPVTAPPQPGQIRAGAHSDYGTLTLLFQDQVGGLEVLNTEGEWVDALPISDAVLINTGDLMERWSNGVFRSTKHRVRLPGVEEAGSDRYSIAFFCQPDPATEIVCLPTCQSPNYPPQYPPTTAGDYLISRLQATY